MATGLDPQTSDVQEISQIKDGGMLASHSRILSESLLLPEALAALIRQNNSKRLKKDLSLLSKILKTTRASPTHKSIRDSIEMAESSLMPFKKQSVSD